MGTAGEVAAVVVERRAWRGESFGHGIFVFRDSMGSRGGYGWVVWDDNARRAIETGIRTKKSAVAYARHVAGSR